ncbi:hypothetical protein [Streptomyces sp. NPDC006368]|uniref:hypothetical protein n=1 Tax=Streptomyces sp. NPDC006368 TaxID=3156760 RepID=UPI0033BA40B1
MLALANATPAQAAAPQQSCTMVYAGNIEAYAMTCSEPGEPMIGGFATWRNVPVTFDKVDTPNTTVTAANYLRLTPNTEGSPFAHNIEIGLYAEKTGKTSHTYGPKWTELGKNGGKTKAITAGVDPAKPDGRNHTYMLVRKATGDQWDVLYDFNTVGSTTDQLKVVPGATNRIDTGLELIGHQYIDVPQIANRMQFMDGNKTWRQVATKNTAKVVTLPACSASKKPPSCFTAKLTDNTSFAQWTVSKPRKAAAAAAGATNTSSLVQRHAAPAPVLYNGVDQTALQQCLTGEPDRCLGTVPGLAECVQTIRQCNAATPASEAPTDQRQYVTGDDVAARAAETFHVSPGDVTVTAAGARSAVADEQQVWHVTSSRTTPGLRPAGRTYAGFEATYSAFGGRLLEACWGDMCHD